MGQVQAVTDHCGSLVCYCSVIAVYISLTCMCSFDQLMQRDSPYQWNAAPAMDSLANIALC